MIIVNHRKFFVPLELSNDLNVNKISVNLIYRIPKKKSQSPRHRKMNGLLYWLSREKDVTSAIERLMQSIPIKDRTTLRLKLESAIDMYKLEAPQKGDNRSNQLEIFNNIEFLFDDQSLKQSLDETFLSGYSSSTFPSWLLDVILHEQVYLPCQVEDKEHPSSHGFAEDILKAICEIAFSFKKENKTTPKEVVVKLIGRDRNKCVSQVIKCNSNNSEFTNLETMKSSDRLVLLFHILKLPENQYDVINNCDNSLKLLFLCINFWCTNRKHSVIAPNQIELGAIIAMISIYTCGLMSKINSSGEKIDKIKPLFVPNHDLKSSRRLFDIAIVQVFANLQSTIMYSIIANRLLNYPIEEPNIHEIWNSTFLYNVSNRFTTILELQNYLDLKQFEEYMKLSAVLIQNYSSLKSKEVSRRRKRAKKKTQVSVKITTDEVDSEEDEFVDNNEYQDMCNKFSVLCNE